MSLKKNSGVSDSLPLQYALRRMDETDLDWVLRARNSQSVRDASSSPLRIRRDHHRVWFDCSVNLLKLVFTENNAPKGVVLYDRVSQYWSFYLVPSRRTRTGLGRLMLSMFLVHAKRSGIKTIEAMVKEENYGSRYLHRDLGFGDVYKEDGQLRMRKDF